MSDNPAAHKGSYHQLFHSIRDEEVEKTIAKAAKEMNRLGVNAWEVCLQKKSTELGRAENKKKFQLPDECKNLIWKILGSECENRRALAPTPAMMQSKVEARRKEMVDLVVEEFLKIFQEVTGQYGSAGVYINKEAFITAAEKLGVVEDVEDSYLGGFPKLRPVKKALEAMGYECESVVANDVAEELRTEYPDGYFVITLPGLSDGASDEEEEEYDDDDDEY